MSELNEIWKDIENWPYHQVSNLGRVRVLPGGKVRNRTIVRTELRILNTKGGYLQVARLKKHIYVHTLVLNAFAGPCPSRHECRHLNGNPSDNRWPENLVWDTHKRNLQDCVAHGTATIGERHGSCKLTESDISNIRAQPQRYGINTELAIRYKVSRVQILRIRRGLRWKHL
jgi:hypothetical protein